jgi:gas vesicle protein
MKEATRLITVAGLGAVAALCLAAAAAPDQGGCARTADVTKLSKRFDEVQQTLDALQTQSTQAASNAALASANTQRQIQSVGSQVAALNDVVLSVARH